MTTSPWAFIFESASSLSSLWIFPWISLFVLLDFLCLFDPGLGCGMPISSLQSFMRYSQPQLGHGLDFVGPSSTQFMFLPLIAEEEPYTQVHPTWYM